MDAYEGETVRLQQPCLRCGGVMQQGFVPEHKRFSAWASVWVEGTPEWSARGGDAVTRDRATFLIRAYRCTSCGYLEFYANEEL